MTEQELHTKLKVSKQCHDYREISRFSYTGIRLEGAVRVIEADRLGKEQTMHPDRIKEKYLMPHNYQCLV